MRTGFPLASAGLRVGLLGGSFDPPHAGHVHISKWAMRAFGLDRVWWLVSPGNPLKEHGPADLDHRLAACRDLIDHPRIIATDLERRFGTRYTAATLGHVTAAYPDVRFVWLMGSDNLGQFHKWDRWQDIMNIMPVGVLARPGEQLAAGCSPAARSFAGARLSARRSTALPFREAPCWSLVTGPMVDISSSEIRARGDWPKE